MIEDFKRMAETLGYTHEISETETEIIERVVRPDGTTVAMARRNKSAEDHARGIIDKSADDHHTGVTSGGTGGWIDASPFVPKDLVATDAGHQSRCRNPRCKASLDGRDTFCAGCRYAGTVGILLGVLLGGVITSLIVLWGAGQ